MDAGLVIGAFLLGAGGSPHCALMCAAPCAALTRGGPADTALFQAGRALGYMAGGAVAAASVAALATWSQAWPVMRPLWVLLHAAMLVLGAWLLWRGRQPAWLAVRTPAVALPGGWQGLGLPRRAGTVGRHARRAGVVGLSGLAWVAWPCALLQTALVMAGLASHAAGGAAVMGAFALGSLPALWVGPLLWQRLVRGGGPAAGARLQRWSLRSAGALLALSSAWALGHVWVERVAAWCAAA
jgi:sulfite exporter TauE/SafE